MPRTCFVSGRLLLRVRGALVLFLSLSSVLFCQQLRKSRARKEFVLLFLVLHGNFITYSPK